MKVLTSFLHHDFLGSVDPRVLDRDPRVHLDCFLLHLLQGPGMEDLVEFHQADHLKKIWR